jgi:hypothetical protein
MIGLVAIVTVECWLRTFKLIGGDVAGTCFVITHHGDQWLVAAKHVIDNLKSPPGVVAARISVIPCGGAFTDAPVCHGF